MSALGGEEIPSRFCSICHKPIWSYQRKDTIFGMWHKACLKKGKVGKHYIEYIIPTTGGRIRIGR